MSEEEGCHVLSEEEGCHALSEEEGYRALSEEEGCHVLSEEEGYRALSEEHSRGEEVRAVEGEEVDSHHLSSLSNGLCHFDVLFDPYPLICCHLTSRRSYQKIQRRMSLKGNDGISSDSFDLPCLASLCQRAHAHFL